MKKQILLSSSKQAYIQSYSISLCETCRMDKTGSSSIDLDEFQNYMLLYPSTDPRDIAHFWRHNLVRFFLFAYSIAVVSIRLKRQML